MSSAVNLARTLGPAQMRRVRCSRHTRLGDRGPSTCCGATLGSGLERKSVRVGCVEVRRAGWISGVPFKSLTNQRTREWLEVVWSGKSVEVNGISTDGYAELLLPEPYECFQKSMTILQKCGKKLGLDLPSHFTPRMNKR